MILIGILEVCMFPKTACRKASACFLTLLSVIVLLFSFSACTGGNNPTPPGQGDNGQDNRYCSFEISNLNDTFDLNKIEFSVNFGVNSTDTANYKAAFSMADTTDYTLHVLYTISDLVVDDFSFSYANNAYTYKKTAKLKMSSDYFANNQGTILLQFCLYARDDEDFTNASTGYAYKLNYTIDENTISFVPESGFIIRHP